MILRERMDIWVFQRENIACAQAKNGEWLKVILKIVNT